MANTPDNPSRRPGQSVADWLRNKSKPRDIREVHDSPFAPVPPFTVEIYSRETADDCPPQPATIKHLPSMASTSKPDEPRKIQPLPGMKLAGNTGQTEQVGQQSKPIKPKIKPLPGMRSTQTVEQPQSEQVNQSARPWGDLRKGIPQSSKYAFIYTQSGLNKTAEWKKKTGNVSLQLPIDLPEGLIVCVQTQFEPQYYKIGKMINRGFGDIYDATLLSFNDMRNVSQFNPKYDTETDVAWLLKSTFVKPEDLREIYTPVP